MKKKRSLTLSKTKYKRQFDSLSNELRLREERLRLIIEGTQDGVWDWNIKDGAYYFSERWTSMLGLKNDEVSHHFNSWLKLVHPDDLGVFLVTWIEAVDDQKENYSIEYRLRHKQGHYLWVQGRSCILYDNKGDPYRMAGSNTDITQRKQYEINILKKSKELEKSYSDLSVTQNKLIESEALASLSTLVAGVAHEINTPTGNAITACSYIETCIESFKRHYLADELTKKNMDDFIADLEEGFSMVSSNLQRAAKMVRSFKKISTDEASGELRKFNLSRYMDEILLSLKPNLKKTQHQVNVICHESITLYSYPGAIAQLITNLVMNTLLHGFKDKKNGKITIKIYKSGENIIINYSDNGHGINDNNLKKIFTPFYTTARGKGGTGLGLCIVNNVVKKKLQGTISCQSTVGKGTTFEIIINKSIIK